MNRVQMIFGLVIPFVILLFFHHEIANAQIPPVSSPQKVGCFDGNGQPVKCGERYVAVRNGVVYDCVCNCSGTDDCTPRSQSGDPNRNGQDDQRPDDPSVEQSDNSAAIEAEHKRQTEEYERLERERREAFAREHDALLNNLKGGGTTGTPGLKTGATALPLKKSGSSAPLGLKTSDPAAGTSGSLPPEVRRELVESLSDAIHNRVVTPNVHAQEILRSLKTNKPPSLFKNLSNLTAGDVILVAPISFKDTNETSIWKKGQSQAISFVDQWGSNRWNADASHAAIFLGVRNGKRWYLDNTSERGPVILEEHAFMKEYGQRQMDIATYVGDPVSKEQGEEIWKAAHELRNTTTYGIWADKRMVCSETSRWVLLRAGRDVPQRTSDNARILGFDTGLNKGDFVKYSPADFYENYQYFVIQRLSK